MCRLLRFGSSLVTVIFNCPNKLSLSFLICNRENTTYTAGAFCEIRDNSLKDTWNGIVPLLMLSSRLPFGAIMSGLANDWEWHAPPTCRCPPAFNIVTRPKHPSQPLVFLLMTIALWESWTIRMYYLQGVKINSKGNVTHGGHVHLNEHCFVIDWPLRKKKLKF